MDGPKDKDSGYEDCTDDCCEADTAADAIDAMGRGIFYSALGALCESPVSSGG